MQSRGRHGLESCPLLDFHFSGSFTSAQVPLFLAVMVILKSLKSTHCADDASTDDVFHVVGCNQFCASVK